MPDAPAATARRLTGWGTPLPLHCQDQGCYSSSTASLPTTWPSGYLKCDPRAWFRWSDTEDSSLALRFLARIEPSWHWILQRIVNPSDRRSTSRWARTCSGQAPSIPARHSPVWVPRVPTSIVATSLVTFNTQLAQSVPPHQGAEDNARLPFRSPSNEAEEQRRAGSSW